MTVASEDTRVSYTGAGTTGPFTVPYYFLDDGHLKVIKTTIADGSEQTLTLNSDYTVAGAGVPAGGSVTTAAAVTSAYTLTILRDPDSLQLVSYPPNDPFPAETHEGALDKLTMIIQRLKDLAARSFTMSDGATSIPSLKIPSPVADRLLGWNAAEDALENKEVVSLGTIILPLPVDQGGTGATTEADARTALGLEIGEDVQAYDADIIAVAPGTPGDVLTSNGSAWESAAPAASGGFPTGTKMLFQQTAAPTGWTKDTTHNDKALRVVTGTASSGGTNAFSTVLSGSTGETTLSIAQIPAHDHGISNGISGSYNTANLVMGSQITTAYKTGSAGGGGSHSHSMAVQYVDVIIAEKD
jgi:hypothetical protein